MKIDRSSPSLFSHRLLASLLPLALLAQPALAQKTDEVAAEKLNLATEYEAIDMVWSGHRVHSQMIQRGEHQFIVYYDASRQMSVAHRPDIRSPWRYHKLPSFVGWDSHNYATIDIDETGHIHVLGNMHSDPIIYFRSREPYNVRTLEQVEYLADKAREQEVTYPRFLHDDKGRLIAVFRIGSSGEGKYYFHRYDTASKTWSLMHGGQMFDGEGERGSYYNGPDLGPDGMFHMVWVWRETKSADTNNNLSYVRSRDMINWETSNGEPVSLPIIRATGEIIDPVPVGGGMLNGQTRIGFDPDGLPMVAYYKNDARGDTQIHLARKAGDGWSTHQISDWTGSRQELDLGGSLNVSILVPENPFVAEDGTIRVRARRDGAPIEFIVDPATNRLVSKTAYELVPAQIANLRDNPALVQYVFAAEGVPASSEHDYYISWEANPSFQDQARPEIPAPVTLRLHRIAR